MAGKSVACLVGKEILRALLSLQPSLTRFRLFSLVVEEELVFCGRIPVIQLLGVTLAGLPTCFGLKRAGPPPFASHFRQLFRSNVLSCFQEEQHHSGS